MNRLHPSSIPNNADVILTCVRAALDGAEDTRKGGPPTSAGAREIMGKLLDFPQDYLPGAVLSEIAECDVAAMVDQLLVECPEIEIPEHYHDRVDFVWRKAAGKSQGAVVLGSLKPVGKRERQTWQGQGRAPWWRITLSLDVWCLLTREERWRLLHHELMHATVKEDANGEITGPSGRAHDVEEWAATVGRYGLAAEQQARFVGQALARDVGEDLRVYGVDPATGQGLLFSADALTPVGW